jgi:hypothetical protein
VRVSSFERTITNLRSNAGDIDTDSLLGLGRALCRNIRRSKRQLSLWLFIDLKNIASGSNFILIPLLFAYFACIRTYCTFGHYLDVAFQIRQRRRPCDRRLLWPCARNSMLSSIGRGVTQIWLLAWFRSLSLDELRIYKEIVNRFFSETGRWDLYFRSSWVLVLKFSCAH